MIEYIKTVFKEMTEDEKAFCGMGFTMGAMFISLLYILRLIIFGM